MITRDELVQVAIRAYKDNPRLDATSTGLTWLRVPMERVVDTLEPLIRADERAWCDRDDA